MLVPIFVPAAHRRGPGRALMATILIVDDRPSNRAYLMALLGFTEHRLLEAEDGAAALQLVRAERPDLIITDILMPTMDGYEFVQRLRADRALAATRVIFYSAVYAERETIAMARSCGVHTVLSKPSDPQDIMAAVNAELGLSSAAAPQDAPAAARSAPQRRPVPARPRRCPSSTAASARAWPRSKRCACTWSTSARWTAWSTSSWKPRQRILDADQLALCLLENDERTVSHLNARGLDPALLLPYATGTRLPGALLLATRHPCGWAKAIRCWAPCPPACRAARSFLGLPVRCLRNLYGWLYLVRAPSAAPFSAEDERWASVLAAHLAVAYENLNLYGVVQRHAAQLQLEATARAQSDAALRESEHRLELSRQVFDSTQESIMMTDASANIVAVNPAFEQITGWREAEVIGLNPRVLRSGRHDAASTAPCGMASSAMANGAARSGTAARTAKSTRSASASAPCATPKAS